MKTFSLTLVCCICFLNQRVRPVIKILQRVGVKKEALESFISALWVRRIFAGLSVVVINYNKIVYQQIFGRKNKQTNAPLKNTTIMYAPSFTKPVAANAFLKLVE
jgi:CubicO group peptidase (beta-lactamase class C family)